MSIYEGLTIKKYAYSPKNSLNLFIFMAVSIKNKK